MKKLTLSFILILSLTFSYAESLQNNTIFKPRTPVNKIIEQYLHDPDYKLESWTDESVIYKKKENGLLFEYRISFAFNKDGELLAETLIYDATEYLSDELLEDFFVKIYNNYLSSYNLKLESFNLSSNRAMLMYRNLDLPDETLSFFYTIGDDVKTPMICRTILFN